MIKQSKVESESMEMPVDFWNHKVNPITGQYSTKEPKNKSQGIKSVNIDVV